MSTEPQPMSAFAVPFTYEIDCGLPKALRPRRTGYASMICGSVARACIEQLLVERGTLDPLLAQETLKPRG